MTHLSRMESRKGVMQVHTKLEPVALSFGCTFCSLPKLVSCNITVVFLMSTLLVETLCIKV